MRWIDLVYYTWCLPQTLLGHIVLLFCKKIEKKQYKLSTVHIIDNVFGVSLGRHIIVGHAYNDERTIKHEYGHVLQSLMLGPLYLPVVGLPSAIMNIISRFDYIWGKGNFADNYYERWPENWADKLGGVALKIKGL